jgi:hypothetical protein
MDNQEARRNLLQVLTKVDVENYKSPRANFENCSNPQVIFNVNMDKEDFDPIRADNRIREILGITEEECPSLQSQGHKELPASTGINGWTVADTFFRWYFGMMMILIVLSAIGIAWILLK